MQWLTDFAEWLLDIFFFIPRWVFAKTLDAAAFIIEEFPVPDAFAEWFSYSYWPETLVWFTTLFALRKGITLVLGALLARWLLRIVIGRIQSA
jgi:hypothetical protein